jgi:hypothetical protein
MSLFILTKTEEPSVAMKCSLNLPSVSKSTSGLLGFLHKNRRAEVGHLHGTGDLPRRREVARMLCQRPEQSVVPKEAAPLISPVAIFATMTAAPIASAGRFEPLAGCGKTQRNVDEAQH